MSIINQSDIRTRSGSEVVINKVLANTYALLSATLIFSAITAGISMAMNVPPLGLITLLFYFGLLFWVHIARNSVWGIVATFALTGFLGFTLGPILNFYISAFSNGTELVMLSLGGTGIIFVAMTAFAMKSGRSFSNLGKTLTIGILIAFVASIANIFFAIPALSLAISSVFVILMSGMILYQTSEIINGGERNYILATITLYVSLYNLFLSLLHLLAALFGNRD